MSRLFGTDGVRGVANLELTPELAFRLGEAAGHFLGDKGRGRILVGKDTRKSGDMIEAALVAGICSGGADALVCGVIPTPGIAYLTRVFEADGGVVISASHNPPEYNGIKFFSRDGFKLPDELEDEIEEFTHRKRTWERPTGAAVGRVRTIPDAVARYIAHAVESIDCDLEGLTIAVDCGHGAASVATPQALRELGAKVIVINDDCQELRNNTVVGTVMSNMGFEVAMREYGINVVKTKVGDRYVLEQMLTMDAVLGGEQSGHIIFLEHNTTGDGLVTALKLAAVMKERDLPLSELRQVMRRFPQVLINVHVADKALLVTSAAIAEGRLGIY